MYKPTPGPAAKKPTTASGGLRSFKKKERIDVKTIVFFLEFDV